MPFDHNTDRWIAKSSTNEISEPITNTKRLARAAAVVSLVATTIAVGAALVTSGWGIENAEISSEASAVKSAQIAEGLIESPAKHLENILKSPDDYTLPFVHKLQTKVDNETFSERLLHLTKTKEVLADYVHRTYRVPKDLAVDIISYAVSSSHENGLDPLVVTAVIAVESSFNPNAQSSYGAFGLMQVHPPSHKDLLDDLGFPTHNPKKTAEMLKANIGPNIDAGAEILGGYVKQYKDKAKALQAYNGNRKDTTMHYSKTVLAVVDDLQRHIQHTVYVPQESMMNSLSN